MPRSKFHNKPFDEGTLTKLNLFELYTREWLPVFLAKPTPLQRVIHLFDFFAGPGTDSKGIPGSPIRLLKQLEAYRDKPGWSKVQIHVHLFDKSVSKIKRLRQNISPLTSRLEGITVECERREFAKAFEASELLLRDQNAAKLVFIDQFGVDEVTNDVFNKLATAPLVTFVSS